MKIGILGGAFDPPHIGHLIVATQIKEYLDLDEIWLMPMYSHPFSKSLSPASHRLAMTKLCETEVIKASDFELKKGTTSYTIETLELLKQRCPENQFYWCIGSDMLKDFQKWRRWKELMAHHNLVIYPRGTGVIDLVPHVSQAFDTHPLPSHIYPVAHKDVVITNISSTLVRGRLAEGLAIDYIVPKAVIEYIQKHTLYRHHE
jgi:nicotinate-nucleotide adenylyltransferase